MHKPKYRNRYSIFQNQLICINAFVSCNPLPTLHTQLQGSAHIAMDSTRPSCTQLRSLYLLLQPKLGITNSNLLSLHMLILLPFLPKTIFYAYSLALIYTFMGRPTHSRLTYNILGRTTLGLDPLQFALCALCGPFTVQYPKMWDSSPKTVTQGIRYLT